MFYLYNFVTRCLKLSNNAEKTVKCNGVLKSE